MGARDNRAGPGPQRRGEDGERRGDRRGRQIALHGRASYQALCRPAKPLPGSESHSEFLIISERWEMEVGERV